MKTNCKNIPYLPSYFHSFKSHGLQSGEEVYLYIV